MRPSGVELLDRSLGGVSPGLPLVITGPAASGRTVLALQLVAAAVGRGERAQLVTPVPPPLLLRQARSFGFDLGAAVRDERLALLELDAGAGERLRALGGGAFLAALREDLPDVQLLVLDPVNAIAGEQLDETSLRAFVRGLFARGSGVVAVTVDHDALAASPVLDRALADMCGARVRLSREADGRRWLHVETSRSGTPLAERLAFTIDARGARIVGTSAPAARVGSPPTAEASDAPQARVLVVEDDITVRRQIVDWLHDRYSVSEAEDGFTALSEVLAAPPDVLIVDLVLPRVGGAELLAALGKAAAATPTLVISSRMARAADRVRVLALGASDTLVKPIHRLELLRKVETLLSVPRDGAPSPLLADAATLLADSSATRVLSAPDFAERVRRAVRFGRVADMPSALIAVEASGANDLDALVHVADATLRTEDGILALSDRRALLLLVASPLQSCEPVMQRLTTGLVENGVAPASLAWSARLADVADAPEGDAASDPTWKRCFEDLAPWPWRTAAW